LGENANTYKKVTKLQKEKDQKPEEITVVGLVQSTDINNSVPQPCSHNTCYPNQM